MPTVRIEHSLSLTSLAMWFLMLLGGWMVPTECALFFREASAQATIEAPYEWVWSTMVDTASYPAWNPYVLGFDPPQMDLTRVGNKFVLLTRAYTRFSNVTRSPEMVTQVILPGSSADRVAYLAYDFDGRIKKQLGYPSRQQRITALNDTFCRYETREQFCNWLSISVPLAQVQQGFYDSTAALKQEAESRWARNQTNLA